VTTDMLTSLLAQRVLGWTVAPDRFLMGGRRWLPRWRFKPVEDLTDAFQLLDGAAPDEYSMTGGNRGGFRVRVRIGDATGESCGASKPLAITIAIARALGIEVEP
jgi:hypothetical protein